MDANNLNDKEIRSIIFTIARYESERSVMQLMGSHVEPERHLEQCGDHTGFDARILEDYNLLRKYCSGHTMLALAERLDDSTMELIKNQVRIYRDDFRSDNCESKNS